MSRSVSRWRLRTINAIAEHQVGDSYSVVDRRMSARSYMVGMKAGGWICGNAVLAAVGTTRDASEFTIWSSGFTMAAISAAAVAGCCYLGAVRTTDGLQRELSDTHPQ